MERDRSFPLLAEQDPAYLVFQPVGFTEMPTSLPASVGFYLARRLRVVPSREGRLHVFTRSLVLRPRWSPFLWHFP
jgi:hypothetical protein